jgi:cephalosporin hydroxylase
VSISVSSPDGLEEDLGVKIMNGVRGKIQLRTRIRKYLATHGAHRRVIYAFHNLYYNAEDRTFQSTQWLGIRALKLPLDLWIYQEIIYEVKPDLIIETGTAHGGGALFLASMCDLLGHGRVVTIDIVNREGMPDHPRITYLVGSSTSPEIVGKVNGVTHPGDRVMVILDSDHRKDHVLLELELYSDLVSPGSYLIVEDTNVNGHPVFASHGPGPMEAVEEYLHRDRRFVVDHSREKFLFTFNPGGYLRKGDEQTPLPARGAKDADTPTSEIRALA